MNKKTKIITLSLFGVTLLTTGAIATSVTLVSCSINYPNKPTDEWWKPSKIESYKNAEGGMFYTEDNYCAMMDKTETPFKCDFDTTNKTCSIVEYIGNQPNYFIPGLPNIQTNPKTPNDKNNTLRIPSKILYNNEEYDVVSFSSYNGNNIIRTLDIDCIAESTQVIEFDNNLNKQLATDSLPHKINITPSKYNNLIEISNFPGNLVFDTTNYSNLQTFTFNHSYQYHHTNQQRDWLDFSNNKSLKSIKIPNSVIEIGLEAFEGCYSLENIDIPDSVTGIGSEAFSSCWNLQNVNIPNSVIYIGSYAFAGCSSLQSINIPDSVTIIEDRIFSGCSNLQNINIPNSVTSIESSAFEGCSIQTINIPNSVTSIESSAFSACSSLKTIDIPNSVTNFGDDIFWECRSLESITFHSQKTMDLFLETNRGAILLCQLI